MGLWAWDGKMKDLCFISVFLMKYVAKLSAESEGQGRVRGLRQGEARRGMGSPFEV